MPLGLGKPRKTGVTNVIPDGCRFRALPVPLVACVLLSCGGPSKAPGLPTANRAAPMLAEPADAALPADARLITDAGRAVTTEAPGECVPSETSACFFHADLEHAILLLSRLHRVPIVLLGAYDLHITGAVPTRPLEDTWVVLSREAHAQSVLLDHTFRDGAHYLYERSKRDSFSQPPAPMRCTPPVDLELQRASLESLVHLVADVSHRHFSRDPEHAGPGGYVSAIGREQDVCTLLSHVVELSGATFRQSHAGLDILGAPLLVPATEPLKPSAPRCTEAPPLGCWKIEDLEVVAVAGAPDSRVALVRSRYGGESFAPATVVREGTLIGRDSLRVTSIDQFGVHGDGNRTIAAAR